jgi:hypothetical protein
VGGSVSLRDWYKARVNVGRRSSREDPCSWGVIYNDYAGTQPIAWRIGGYAVVGGAVMVGVAICSELGDWRLI